MNPRLISLVLLSCALCALAQLDTVNDFFGHQAEGRASFSTVVTPIDSWEAKADGLWISTAQGTLLIQPYQGGALRLCYAASHKIGPAQSYAFPSEPLVAEYTIDESAQAITLRTDRYSARVDKSTGSVSYANAEDKTVLKENPTAARSAIVGDSVTPAARFILSDSEAIYGLGQFRDSLLNLRGHQRELIQFNTQAAVPVIYSTAGWGIFWNNPSRTLFADSPTQGMTLVSDYGDTVDYYVFFGSSLDDLIAQYRLITGAAPMPPLWSLGYHQSRNRYHNSQELYDVANRMRQEQIPMSSIFIDYHHWGKHGTGSFRFDLDNYPDPKVMIDSLHSLGTHAVITVWPSFKPETPNHKYMTERGFLLDSARAIDGFIYDPFNPDAREAYWQCFKPMLQYGIDGWFLDGPEPDHTQSFLPSVTYAGPAPRVRNLYPIAHISNFVDHLNAYEPDKRHYILTRCAWAGQQRYGSAVWSGDIPSDFHELALQVAAGLSFTATGIPYWTTDIGGYLLGDPQDQAYREIFTRWFQYGTFCPVFRAHGRRSPGDTTGPNELWAYGPEAMEICKSFINLRYDLMPYIYSLSAMVTNQGYTPMRLLAFDYPQYVEALDCRDQFMYGPALMVCPVVQAGATERKVWLPSTDKWYDFWSEELYEGPELFTDSTPISRIPVYVRAGSIIPCADTVKVYTGQDGQFTLYSDDGISTNPTPSLTHYSWNDSTGILTINGENRQPIQFIGKTGQVRYE
ncbi:MAG: glycoside hydrolase family 31 protein [Bacteroidales bacterium]|nr:glycoside hydrolase family 31 protein [Bacteroidales bacterium]